MWKEPVYGLDFGTNNTLIAVHEHGQIRLLTETPVSSMLCMHEGQLRRCEQHGITGFKRLIGRSQLIHLGGKAYTPEDLVTHYLTLLREEFDIPRGVTTVMSVPAAFTYEQRILLRNAARRAGWQVEKLIDEPSAAIIAGAVHRQYTHASILLVDLGAGTTDVSILDIDGSSWRITAVQGVSFGGMDADRILAKQLTLRLEAYAEEVRRLRERLSEEEEACLMLRERTVRATRRAFEACLQPILEETLGSLLRRTLNEARLKPWEIDVILLTGGFSQTPLIRRFIQAFFQREAYPINPYTAVVEGSLLSLGMTRLTQRAGVRIHIGKTTLIHPHETLPARGETILTTREDHTRIGIIPLHADGRRIGSLSLPLLPSEAGSVQVRVNLTLFENGELHAEAEDLATGRRLQARLMLASHLRAESSVHSLKHQASSRGTSEEGGYVPEEGEEGLKAKPSGQQELLMQRPDQQLSRLRKRLEEYE